MQVCADIDVQEDIGVDGMVMDKVTVRSPATLSNLGSGFDVFGLALREPYDIIEAKRIPEREVVIEAIEGRGADSIATIADKNSAGISAMAVLKSAKADFGLAIRIKKGIRPSSGIGSSGASAAGGACVANLLLDRPLGPEDLVFCAAQAEKVTSGSFHADNVAPAVMGGFTIIKSYDPFEVLRADPPRNLGVVVTMPDFLVSTKESRKVLPSQVDLKNMVYEVGNASSLVLGICRGDVGLVGRSMRDAVIEPARASLNPHLREAQERARGAGAVGTFLGGSGPCVIAVYDMNRVNGNDIAAAMRRVYADHGLESETWVTTWGEGCRRV